MKTITLKLTPDGRIEVHTHGMKGMSCLSYVRILEQLTDAVAVDSAFTEEFRESECPQAAQWEEETVCEK